MNEKEKLLNEWIEQKRIEEDAKHRREEISQLIEKLYTLDNGKDSQSFSDGSFKIEIKKPTKIEVDQKAAEILYSRYMDKVLPFRKKFDLDKKKYDTIKDLDHDFYKECSEAVTDKPGKTSVKVTLQESV